MDNINQEWREDILKRLSKFVPENLMEEIYKIEDPKELHQLLENNNCFELLEKAENE